MLGFLFFLPLKKRQRGEKKGNVLGEFHGESRQQATQADLMMYSVAALTY